MEQRSIIADQIELRTVNGKPTISGYASVYNSKSQDLGGYYEVVKPGAFDRTLNDPNAEVIARIEHQGGLMIIGKRSNGSLKLESNQTGLKYFISPPDTTAARDLMELLRTGLIDKSSFAFTVNKNGEDWDYSTKVPTRYLTDVSLVDVAPVSSPAYEKTSVQLRAMAGKEMQDLRARIAAIKESN